jgi:hypothetical protein
MSLNPNSPSRDHLDKNKLLLAHSSHSTIRYLFFCAAAVRAFRARVLVSHPQPPKLGLNTFQFTNLWSFTDPLHVQSTIVLAPMIPVMYLH